MAKSYDVIIIGGGPGGYNCAIRAAQLGLHVACVEKRGALGGTCLNIGCIPSKALLHASELYEEVANGIAEARRDRQERLVRFESNDGEQGCRRRPAHQRHSLSVQASTRSTRSSAKPNSRRRAASTVALNDGGAKSCRPKSIVIATGSESDGPAGRPDRRKVRCFLDWRAFACQGAGHLFVVGGGIIGLELGSVWRRLGAKVTVVEFLPRIAPGVDDESPRRFSACCKSRA